MLRDRATGRLDSKVWEKNVLDIQHLWRLARSLWLLLEHNNEAMFRVALELVTCGKTKQCVNWHEALWFQDDLQREEFSGMVREKLAHVLTTVGMPHAPSTHDKTKVCKPIIGKEGASPTKARRDSFSAETQTIPRTTKDTCLPLYAGMRHDAASQTDKVLEIPRPNLLSSDKKAASTPTSSSSPNLATTVVERITVCERGQVKGACVSVCERCQGKGTSKSEEQEAFRKRIRELEAERNDLTAEVQTEKSNAAANAAELKNKLADKETSLQNHSLVLEEMSLKLKEFCVESAAVGAFPMVQELLHKVGLDEVLKHATVWERLYKDAMERIKRLEQFQAEIRPMGHLDFIPGCSLLAEMRQSSLACLLINKPLRLTRRPPKGRAGGASDAVGRGEVLQLQEVRPPSSGLGAAPRDVGGVLPPLGECHLSRFSGIGAAGNQFQPRNANRRHKKLGHLTESMSLPALPQMQQWAGDRQVRRT